MSWFDSLCGFPERDPRGVRGNLERSGDRLHSKINGKTYTCGTLSTPSLEQLRHLLQQQPPAAGTLAVDEVVADVTALHADAGNAGACFQVASQFNLLEMASPSVTPEQGVGIYAQDPTQGPACAVACGAGTIYRNYFAPVKGQTGQSADKQINCLEDLAKALGVGIPMQNGYAFPDETTLLRISEQLQCASSEGREKLKSQLRIGVQAHTEVTLPGCGHRVHQIYGSALPVGYSPHAPEIWEPFARLVLEASYEACIAQTLLLGSDRLYLTLLGGGVFGNRINWITDAIAQALNRFTGTRLHLSLVSYRNPRPEIRHLLTASFDDDISPTQ